MDNTTSGEAESNIISGTPDCIPGVIGREKSSSAESPSKHTIMESQDLPDSVEMGHDSTLTTAGSCVNKKCQNPPNKEQPENSQSESLVNLQRNHQESICPPSEEPDLTSFGLSDEIPPSIEMIPNTCLESTSTLLPTSCHNGLEKPAKRSLKVRIFLLLLTYHPG